jgi:hypothetical protein
MSDLDPTDESKPFGEHLSVIIDTIIEQDASDFKEQLYNGDMDWMTDDELTCLQKWFKDWERGEAETWPRDEMEKTGHIWARAWLLQDEINRATGEEA